MSASVAGGEGPEALDWAGAHRRFSASAVQELRVVGDGVVHQVRRASLVRDMPSQVQAPAPS